LGATITSWSFDVKTLLLEASVMAGPPERDHVDRFLEEIRGELPEAMDLVVEGIVDRIQGINWRLRKMLDETLEPYGLASGDWRVLSALRWAGKPYRRSAGELARNADLSSGAMTNRLDQLEKAGFVKRRRDPADGRGVLVELTAKGLRLHREAVEVQAEKEALLAKALTAPEKAQLESLLRRLMLTLEQRATKS
jgi:DNA-binding MarR family transcriptional regulator